MLDGLRVAFLALEAFPNAKGSGTRIAQSVRALADAGAEVTLVTLPGRIEESHPRVTLRPIPLAEGNWLARAQAFRDAAAAVLVDLRPDVVHFRGPFEGQAALAFASSAGARTVFEVNGLPSVELRYHYPGFVEHPALEGRLRRLESRLLSSVDLRITQSETTRRFLLDRGAPPGAPCAVVPNGAAVQPVAEEPEGALRGLYIGSLAPWQGLPELLMALRRARRAGVELSLDLLGPAKKRWRRQLERSARRLKVEEAVRVLPPVPRTELPARLAEAHFSVAPLRSDVRNRVQGCNPIKIYEAMAVGRAVLSTRLACVEEILTHGETGWLVRPSHPRALSEGLIQLSSDGALRRGLGRAARAQLVQGGTWAHRRAALVEAYVRLMSARAAS
ncbi:MAG: glycosyltransferase family 4 protein [Sandaracinaceae bacterium]